MAPKRGRAEEAASPEEEGAAGEEEEVKAGAEVARTPARNQRKRVRRRQESASAEADAADAQRGGRRRRGAARRGDADAGEGRDGEGEEDEDEEEDEEEDEKEEDEAADDAASESSSELEPAANLQKIQSLTQLAAMGAEDMYHSFYVNVLRKVASESSRVREELERQGGANWPAVRAQSFALGRRAPSAAGGGSASDMETYIRGIESRVALELAYRSHVADGVDVLTRQFPQLAQAINLASYKKYYQLMPRRFTVVPYRFAPGYDTSVAPPVISGRGKVLGWDAATTSAFLRHHKLGFLCEKRQLTGRDLLALSRSTLMSEFGVASKAERDRIMEVVASARRGE